LVVLRWEKAGAIKLERENTSSHEGGGGGGFSLFDSTEVGL